MRRKNHHKKQWTTKVSGLCTRLHLFILSAIVISGVLPAYGNLHNDSAIASSCPDLKVIYARGSGSERYTNGHYLAFKSTLETKLITTSLSYEFDDLDYPAASIDIGDGHLGTLLGAYFGGGEAYEFGDSVHLGTKQLLKEVNEDSCKSTKYVLGGYSQGAIVVLDALSKINPNKVVFVATFGDPKIFLPEGAGPVPPACGGKGLSEYRVYVPDCRAYEGMLGARNPYMVAGYEGKVGTWCNRYDILCSSYFSIKSHTSYAEDGLYEDASRYILSKVGASFGIINQYTSPHDTAILIDSTGSMNGLIAKYKTEALRLAQKTLETGGRVALYDYRDLKDGYIPIERCNFSTCTIETFQTGLEAVKPDGGGDTSESLLSASFHVMKQLEWKYGSTKSLVILTDAGYHVPDLDGTTFYDVQKLSKQIDPVNFYIITPEVDKYKSLAEATGGAVASSTDDLSALTDSILERSDSLPRVEEEFGDEEDHNDMPSIKINNIENVSDESIKISFTNSSEATIVVLNGGIIGTTYEREITITGLKNDLDNLITLIPLSTTRRGAGVTIKKPKATEVNISDENCINSTSIKTTTNMHSSHITNTIPKAPNTGRR